MKFVIHRHVTVPDHYDLMFEADDALVTYSINADDFDHFLEGAPVHARRIQDHRREYLTYEGPVSCDRGYVKLYDSGFYTEKIIDQNTRACTISGKVLRGVVSFNKITHDNYHVQFEEGASS